MNDANELERVVNKLSATHMQTLAAIVYNINEPMLLLDGNFNLFFATRAAEEQLGYSLDQIRLDTKRFQTEKKQGFDEIAHENFAKGATSFDLKDIIYQSTDRRYNILMDLHVRRMPDSSICISLGKVARYEASKRPGMFQFRYKKAVGDQTIVVKGFVDYRNDERFMQQVDAAYLRVSGTQKLVIDLSQARDIMDTVLQSLKGHQNLLFVNPGEAMTKDLLAAGIPFDRIQRYELEDNKKHSPAHAC